MNRLLHLNCICLLLAGSVFAGDFEDARKVVENGVNSVLSILAAEAPGDMAVKQERVGAMVDTVFNGPLMAKLTLGREHWGMFDDEQRQEFQRLFIKQLKDSYLGKANLVPGQKVVVGEATKHGSKIHVPTDIVSHGESLAVKYKLRKDKKTGTWRVYDFVVSDVSIVASHQAEYGALLAKMTVDKFLDKLSAKVDPKPEQE